MESDDPTEQHDLGPGAGVDPDDDGHAALDATLQEVLEVGDELDATLQEVLGDGGQWQEAQWQLAVCVGGASIDGELTEAVVHADGLAALQAAALAAADLRSRTVVCVPDTGAESLSCWAYVSGLAGRVLDVVADDQLYDCTGPLSSGREAEETGRPGRKIDSFQVTVAQVLNGLDRDEVGAARYARRTSLVWCDDPVVYQAAAWLAGVRDRRGDGGRLPQLDIDGEDLDLEGVRLAGAAKRRQTNAAANQAVAEAVELSERQLRLVGAAAVAVGDVLTAMGSNQDGGLWNCPRPGRHTHGDAVPSLRVSENSVRCFRCDSEWMDPLRLVMDAMQIGPDDAADLLLALHEGSFEPYAAAIVAERESRGRA